MLSRDQRLALVQEIRDTIAVDQSAPLLNEAQSQELEIRAREDDVSPDDVVPWEQVKAETIARLRQRSACRET
jgi:putative addiction module component (TIGR02574 family)